MRRLGRLGRRVGRPSRRLGRWLGGRPRVFGRGSLFFPCPPGGGLGGEPQARSSSFAFFFSVFASLAEAPALQAPEGGGVQLRQGAFFPLRFSFFFRLPGVELAVKARSSSLGCRPFFFPCQDEKLNAAETRAHGCWSSNGRRRDLFFFFFFSGLGGTRKPVLQVDLMKEIASQARFPSFFSPLSGGVFLVRPHAWRSWRRPCGARKPGRRASRPG